MEWKVPPASFSLHKHSKILLDPTILFETLGTTEETLAPSQWLYKFSFYNDT